MKYFKLFCKFCLDAIVILMVIRSIIFLGWLLGQSPRSVATVGTNQYDWTLIATGVGWFILFLVFTHTQKKELGNDQRNIPYMMPIFWWFYIKKRK